jgi:hypothetical protein
MRHGHRMPIFDHIRIYMITACACALLAACSTAPADNAPVYIASELPSIPAECTQRCPAEPKLPEQDIDDLAAVKDRLAMKTFGRCERHKRRVCAERLKVVLPQR